jgi:hypothetical protein
MMTPMFCAVLGAVGALFAVWVIGRFAGFRSQSPADYAEGSAGLFDLRTHLNGPIRCDGVIYGPLGRVTSRFTAEFDVRWVGREGVMDERFVYADGSRQNRAWHLTLDADGRIEARADDVVGTGRGCQSGDSVQLQYRLRLPQDAGGHVLDVVDWMYLAPGGTIINRSQFRKFGIKVAELVATMRPDKREERQVA